MMQHIFNETAMQASTWANKRRAKVIRRKGTKTGVLMSGIMTRVLLDGVKIANKHMSYR